MTLATAILLVRIPTSVRKAQRVSDSEMCRAQMECTTHVTETGRLHKNCPFMASIAASDASNESKLTKPKPLLLPCVAPSQR